MSPLVKQYLVHRVGVNCVLLLFIFFRVTDIPCLMSIIYIEKILL